MSLYTRGAYKRGNNKIKNCMSLNKGTYTRGRLIYGVLWYIVDCIFYLLADFIHCVDWCK